MDTSLILDYLAIRIRHPDAADLRTTLRLVLPDLDETHTLELSNGVLNHRLGSTDSAVDATVTVARAQLDEMLPAGDPARLLTADEVQIAGDPTGLRAMLGLLDDFPFWFDIVTP